MDRRLLALLTLAASVYAGPEYFVSVNNGIPAYGGAGLNTQGTRSVDHGGPKAKFSWSATTSQGHLGAQVTVAQSGALFTHIAGFAATAGFQYDDIMFVWEGPGPAPAGTFDPILQLKLSGTLGGNSDNFVDPGVAATINSSFGSDSLLGTRIGFMPELGSTFETIVSIQYFGVHYGNAYFLSASLSATASVAGNGSAFSNVGQSLHLVTDRPVFIVPQGVSVYSVQAGISDNRYSLPFAQAPEPQALPLIALAYLLFLGVRAVRRR